LNKSRASALGESRERQHVPARHVLQPQLPTSKNALGRTISDYDGPELLVLTLELRLSQHVSVAPGGCDEYVRRVVQAYREPVEPGHGPGRPDARGPLDDRAVDAAVHRTPGVVMLRAQRDPACDQVTADDIEH
jgi:hypothetical protein